MDGHTVLRFAAGTSFFPLIFSEGTKTDRITQICSPKD